MVRTVVYIGPSLAQLSSPRGIALKGIQAEMRAPGGKWPSVEAGERAQAAAKAALDASASRMISHLSLLMRSRVTLMSASLGVGSPLG